MSCQQCYRLPTSVSRCTAACTRAIPKFYTPSPFILSFERSPATSLELECLRFPNLARLYRLDLSSKSSSVCIAILSLHFRFRQGNRRYQCHWCALSERSTAMIPDWRFLLLLTRVVLFGLEQSPTAQPRRPQTSSDWGSLASCGWRVDQVPSLGGVENPDLAG